jgi:hypothetical protein
MALEVRVMASTRSAGRGVRVGAGDRDGLGVRDWVTKGTKVAVCVTEVVAVRLIGALEQDADTTPRMRPRARPTLLIALPWMQELCA